MHIWKKVEEQHLEESEDPPPFEYEPEVYDEPEENLVSPYQFFKNIIDNDFLNNLTHQSNLYALQKCVNSPPKLTREELEQCMAAWDYQFGLAYLKLVKPVCIGVIQLKMIGVKMY